MSQQYLVKWEIDLDADSAFDAANEALKIQRDSGSDATVFSVRCPDGTTVIEDV